MRTEMVTKHAAIRMKQRGIPPVIIDWLQQFGAEEFDHHGAIRYSFDKRSLKRLQSYLGTQAVGVVEQYRRCYVVVSMDGAVITTGYRHHLH